MPSETASFNLMTFSWVLPPLTMNIKCRSWRRGGIFSGSARHIEYRHCLTLSWYALNVVYLLIHGPSWGNIWRKPMASDQVQSDNIQLMIVRWVYQPATDVWWNFLLFIVLHIMFNLCAQLTDRTLRKWNTELEFRSYCNLPEDNRSRLLQTMRSSWPIFIIDVHFVLSSVLQQEGCTCTGNGNIQQNINDMSRWMRCCSLFLKPTVHVLCAVPPSSNITNVTLFDKWHFCWPKKDTMPLLKDHPLFVNIVARHIRHVMAFYNMPNAITERNRQ